MSVVKTIERSSINMKRSTVGKDLWNCRKLDLHCGRSLPKEMLKEEV